MTYSPFPDPVVVSKPDPSLVSLVTVLLRYVATIGSTVGFLHSAVSDNVLQTLAYAIVGILMVCWAIYNKISEYRHADKVARINAAKPVGSTPVQPERKNILKQ